MSSRLVYFCQILTACLWVFFRTVDYVEKGRKKSYLIFCYLTHVANDLSPAAIMAKNWSVIAKLLFTCKFIRHLSCFSLIWHSNFELSFQATMQEKAKDTYMLEILVDPWDRFDFLSYFMPT